MPKAANASSAMSGTGDRMVDRKLLNFMNDSLTPAAYGLF
jgi:hypothetical protein